MPIYEVTYEMLVTEHITVVEPSPLHAMEAAKQHSTHYKNLKYDAITVSVKCLDPDPDA